MVEHVPPSPTAPTSAQRGLLLALTLLVALFSAARFDGPTRGYWDTYIAVPAMFMTGQHVDLHRIDGSPRYQYHLVGRIPDDTYDPSPAGFGIASKDQRIGTAILFAAPFALLNLAAFRWLFALAWALTFLFAHLSLRRLLGGFWAPLIGAAWLVLNPFSLYLDRLNGNALGLFAMVFLWFLLSERRPVWWLIGLAYGITGGIRNEAIIFGPLFLGWMGLHAAREADGSGGRVVAFARRLVPFTVAAAVGILPVLLWNRHAYGEMIIHPSQVAHLEGYRPTFPHAFFGSTFQFNGLLNAPFHDTLVRTPHFAFPTMLTWPLVQIGSLGLVLGAAAMAGAVALAWRDRFVWALMMYWYGIVAALFVFQENWEELKQTFMALQLFPVAAFLAAGLRWTARHARDLRVWLVLAWCAAVLLCGLMSARQLTFPADERWYVRFPHAARDDAGLDELPVELRKDWQFFYTRETAAEIDRERIHLTRPRPWPTFYRPVHFPDRADWDQLAREPFTREHRTLAIWSYIYE